MQLPTEAQWEYAARGGINSPLNNDGQRDFTYAGTNTIETVAWYKDNSNNITHAIGEKNPNELGLYDMTGNVWEWCKDKYSKIYYFKRVENNPCCTNGLRYVCRGGSWNSKPMYSRTTRRSSAPLSTKEDDVGFRFVYIK